MKSKNAHGKLVSAEDVELEPFGVSDAYTEEPSFPGAGNALWSYQQEGTIGGIPVDEASRGLSIDSDELLYSAFVLDRHPKSTIISLEPEDSKGQDAYNVILDRAYHGEIVLVDEIKQFDAAHSRFIVLIRYDEVRYTLHPRYAYLRG